MALSRVDIARAFQNALGREASQTEENAYFVATQNGISDARIYETISNSREADLNVDPVVRLYQTVFGRVPDKAGLDNATDFIRAYGASVETYEALASQFEQSSEFQARYGTSTSVDAAYVQALYRDILGRQASTAEINGYVSGSNGYDTRGEVLYAISQSNEAIGRADVYVNAYLQNAAEGDATYTGPLYPETTPTQPTEPTNPGGGGNPPQPVNSVPVAVNDTLATVNEDSGPRVITAAELVGNDTDADSDGLRVAFVTSGTGGTAALNADGTVTFTPTANFNGTANFTYVVTDGTATSNAATASFSVAPVNDTPSFTVGTNQTVNEDAAAQTVANFITGLSAGPDEAGQNVSFLTSITNNSLFAVGPSISADGTLTYTLAADANGSATVSVSAQDNGGTANGGIDTSAAQTFTITANAVNDAPTAMDLSQLLTIGEDAAATKLFTVAPTVADIDSTSVTATLTLANTAAGELIGAGTGTAANGATTYTITGTPDVVQTALRAVQFDSAENFNGSVNVSVAISDGANGTQGSNPTGTIAITVTAVNDAPVIAGDTTATVSEDQAAVTGALTIADVDTGQSVFVTQTDTAGTYGTFDLQTGGGYVYTVGAAAQALAADQTGIDTFTAVSADGTTQVVTINVAGVNDAAVITGAVTNTATEDQAQPTTGTLIATDPDAGQNNFTASGGTSAYGAFILQTDGTYSYTLGNGAQALTAGQTVTDNFVVRSFDDTASIVAITVTGVNDAPVVTSGAAASIAENTTGTVYTVTAKDVDTSTTALTYAISGGADAGLFNINVNSGAISFKAAPDFEAPSSAAGSNVYDLLVTATDGAATSAERAVAITVTNLNEPVFSIAALDASKAEGNTDTTAYTFTVSRTSSTDATATLDYAVTGRGTNSADATDFNGGALPGGQVSFAAGESTKTLTINVSGDTIVEQNEGFTVTLSNAPDLGTISTTAGSATGTIVNDDQTDPLPESPAYAFTLTTGTDKITDESGRNVTFVGTINGDDGTDTLNSSDNIDGGDGIDTLQLTSSDSSNTIDYSGSAITGVEALDLRVENANVNSIIVNTQSNDFTSVLIDFRSNVQDSYVDISDIDVNADLTISNGDLNGSEIYIVTNGVGSDDDGAPSAIDGSLTLRNISDADVFVGIDPNQLGTGANDTYSLTLDNVQNTKGLASFGVRDIETLNITVKNVSSLEYLGASYQNTDSSDQTAIDVKFTLNAGLTLGAEGNNNSLDLSDSSGADVSLTIEGKGDLTVYGLDNGSSNLTINASAAEGNIDISNASNQLGKLDVTYGSGDDRLTLQSGFDLSKLTYDGGKGNDTLEFTIGVESTGGPETGGGDPVEPEPVDDGTDYPEPWDGEDGEPEYWDEDGELKPGDEEDGGLAFASAVPAGAEITQSDVNNLREGTLTSVENVKVAFISDATITDFSIAGVETLSLSSRDIVQVVFEGLKATDLNTLDLTGLSGSFSNQGAALNDSGVEVRLGNLRGTSTIDLAVNGTKTDTVQVGSVLTGGVIINNFTGGNRNSGGDLIDFTAQDGKYSYIRTGEDIFIFENGGSSSVRIVGAAQTFSADNITGAKEAVLAD